MKKVLSLILVMAVCCGMLGVGEAWSWKGVPVNYADMPIHDKTDAYSVFIKDNPDAVGVYLMVDILEKYPSTVDFSFKTEDSIPIYLMYNVASPDSITFLYLKENGKYFAAILEIKGKMRKCSVDLWTEVSEKTILKAPDDPYVKIIACDQLDVQLEFMQVPFFWENGKLKETKWWKRLTPDEWTYDWREKKD